MTNEDAFSFSGSDFCDEVDPATGDRSSPLSDDSPVVYFVSDESLRLALSGGGCALADLAGRHPLLLPHWGEKECEAACDLDPDAIRSATALLENVGVRYVPTRMDLIQQLEFLHLHPSWPEHDKLLKAAGEAVSALPAYGDSVQYHCHQDVIALRNWLNLPERTAKEIALVAGKIIELQEKARMSPHFVFRELQLVFLYFRMARNTPSLRFLSRNPDQSLLWRDLATHAPKPAPPVTWEVTAGDAPDVDSLLEILQENQNRHWPVIRRLQMIAAHTDETSGLTSDDTLRRIFDGDSRLEAILAPE
jgi:hypothetical protein